MKRGLMLAIGVAFLAVPVAAEPSEPRCAILGQMGVSSWLSMVANLSTQNEAVIDASLSRLSDISTSYRNLGCDVVPLGAALDCLMGKPAGSDPRMLAQACMAEAGLSQAR
jgi:hypothetical protein|tara:strand:- start:585 stop:917 length:333 start_codon:yes stop_codon:yes gene_type:complete